MKSEFTQEFYDLLVTAYAHFNEELFDGQLPDCIISIQRDSRLTGKFFPERWVSKGGERSHEIGVNPEFFAGRSLVEVFVTLLREMTGMWQHENGTKKFNSRYRNSEWVNKMREFGVISKSDSETGVGFSVELVVAQNGRFMHACQKLIGNGFELKWLDTQARSDEFSAFKITTMESIPAEKNEPIEEPKAEDSESVDEELSLEDEDQIGQHEDVALGSMEEVEIGQLSEIPDITSLRPEPENEEKKPAKKTKPMTEVKDYGEIDQETKDLLTKPIGTSFGDAEINIKQKKEAKKRNKVTYICQGCNSKVWGKPGLRIKCLSCEEDFLENNTNSSENSLK